MPIWEVWGNVVKQITIFKNYWTLRVFLLGFWLEKIMAGLLKRKATCQEEHFDQIEKNQHILVLFRYFGKVLRNSLELLANSMRILIRTLMYSVDKKKFFWRRFCCKGQIFAMVKGRKKADFKRAANESHLFFLQGLGDLQMFLVAHYKK